VKKPEEIRVPEIRFVGEQDGPAERHLKGKLSELFRHSNNVQRAFLARVALRGTGNLDVVLALRFENGPDKDMVNKVGAVFASLFNTDEHLDIVFLTKQQESELIVVCQPFFEKRSILPTF